MHVVRMQHCEQALCRRLSVTRAETRISRTLGERYYYTSHASKHTNDNHAQRNAGFPFGLSERHHAGEQDRNHDYMSSSCLTVRLASS